jgi:cell division protein FtsX
MRNALSGVERALFWTLAFAAFAAAATGLGARAVDRLAAGYEEARANYAIVRVIAPEGPTGIAAAEAALAQSPQVRSAAPMTAGRAAALLGQWSGQRINEADIPALSLIEVELAPTDGAPGDISGDLEAVLAQGGVTAQVIEAPAGSNGGGMATRVRVAALWGALAFGAMMAVIIWLAARGLAARKRELVTVMADLGATRSQAAGRIADEAAVLGLYAGAVGGGLAAIVGLVVLMLSVPHLGFGDLQHVILPVDLTPIIAAPLGAAIAAGAGARAAAGYFHGQAARLG